MATYANFSRDRMLLSMLKGIYIYRVTPRVFSWGALQPEQKQNKKHNNQN